MDSGSRNPMVINAVIGKIDAIRSFLKSPKNKNFLLKQDHKFHVNPLGAAIMTEQPAVIDLILSLPIGRQSTTSVYVHSNALIIAALCANSHAVEASLQHADSPEMLALQTGPNNYSQLMIAASNSEADMIRQLLSLENAEAQAVQSSSQSGGSALGLAIAKNNTAAINFYWNC
jgi:ankyrin repeat protein